MQIVSVIPAPDSAGRPLEQDVQVTFDREVDRTTVDAGSFVVSKRTLVSIDRILTQDTVTASTAVDGSFSFQTADGRTTVTFTPRGPLEPNSEYRVVLSTAIRALDGTSLAGIYQWKFTTGSGAVTEPPGDSSDPVARPYRSTPVTPLAGTADPFLAMVAASPEQQASNLPLSVDTVVLTFNKDLDDSAFSPSSCLWTAEPVDGSPATPAAGALQFTAEVVGRVQLRFSFDLSATPLSPNNRVTLRIGSLQAADGSTLAAPLVYYFTTAYDPLYSTVRLVRSRIGSYIENIPDDTVNLAIHTASLEADWLTQEPAEPGQAFLDRLAATKARYALTTACLTLLLNSDNFGFRRKSKAIGDLEISWEQSRILEELYRDLRQEQRELEQELLNLGRPYLAPQAAVKGALDFDRPLVGRDFSSSPYGAPAANAEVVPGLSRRKFKVWSPGPWRLRRI